MNIEKVAHCRVSDREIRWGNYSLGVEIEFVIPDPKLREKYLRINAFDRKHTILGCDGWGTAIQEFRSPVFQGKNPVKVLDSLINFVIEMQNFLRKNFNVEFTPTYFGDYVDRHENSTLCHQCIRMIDREKLYSDVKTFSHNFHYYCGTHFSLGRKFFSEDPFNRIKILSREIHGLINPDKYVYYNMRDEVWDSRVPGNGLKDQESRLEVRYFPSAPVENLFESFKYLIGAGEVPQTKIDFADPYLFLVEES